MDRSSRDDMTVLDIIVALNNTSDENEILSLTEELEKRSDSNESNTQQHLYAHLNGVVIGAIRTHRLSGNLTSDMEIRARIYENESSLPRCALGVAIIPSPSESVDSEGILKDICSEIWNRNLNGFVDDVTVNDKQMFWGD